MINKKESVRGQDLQSEPPTTNSTNSTNPPTTITAIEEPASNEE